MAASNPDNTTKALIAGAEEKGKDQATPDAGSKTMPPRLSSPAFFPDLNPTSSYGTIPCAITSDKVALLAEVLEASTFSLSELLSKDLYNATFRASSQEVRNYLYSKLVIPFYTDRSKLSVTDTDEGGRTILHWAVLFSQPAEDILELTSPVNVNILTKTGFSPLLMAARLGHTEIVKLLLKAGATADLANENNTTPLTIASKHGHTEVVQLLRVCGAATTKEEFEAALLTLSIEQTQTLARPICNAYIKLMKAYFTHSFVDKIETALTPFLTGEKSIPEIRDTQDAFDSIVGTDPVLCHFAFRMGSSTLPHEGGAAAMAGGDKAEGYEGDDEAEGEEDTPSGGLSP